MRPLADCRLYAFVETAYLQGRAPETVAQQLCDGGADLIQLRAKKSTPDEIRGMVEKILPVTRRANVGLVINDYPEIARDVGAELCHLGQEDFFGAGYTRVTQLKKGRDGSSAGALGERALPGVGIGLSTHSPEQAKRALTAGADYLAIGPVYATATKPTVKPVTLKYVRWAAAPENGVNIPWFAIGGINLKNLDEVLAAGAKRVCVVSAILTAPDVAAACMAFRRRLA